MFSPEKGLSIHGDDNSDAELEQMYQLFGLPSSNNKTNFISTAMSTELDNEQTILSKDERDNYKKMEKTDLHDNDVEDRIKQIIEEVQDNNVKFVRLEDATEMDIEELGASLFLKYTENENNLDDLENAAAEEGVIINGASSSAAQTTNINNVDDDDDDGDNNYYSCCNSSESEEENVNDISVACQPCGNSSSPTNKKSDNTSRYNKKSSDSELKNFAYGIARTKISSCNSRLCKFGGNCVDQTTIADMKVMMESFWGLEDCRAPTTSTRRLMLLAILRSAYRANENEFHFFAGCKATDNRRICEAAYLNLLGLMNSQNVGDAPNQWRRLKEHVSSGNDAAGLTYSAGPEKSKMKGENRVKFNNAVSFVEYFAKTFGDTIPDQHGGLNVYVAPFIDLRSFYLEYKYYAAHHFYRPEIVASFPTFKRAFQDCEKRGIKKLKAKGTFNTCEICNNASLLLANKDRKLKHSQREVVQKFRQLHLTQQSQERQYLDGRKLLAAEVDENGNPLRALLFPDGMTQYTCRTPKFPRASKNDKYIESRIVAMEVFCGPIKTVFVYRMSSMVGGGANLMNELLRQGLFDLCTLLRSRGLRMPRALWLQFDNCGENKNKEMFGYLSLLIEGFFFDSVEVNFLIVGHTHASIDQYFSVIAKAIFKSHFIGSPLALLELIRRCNNQVFGPHQPSVVRDIVVYYDIKKALGPYLNTKIHYYNLPLNFRLKPSYGRTCITQYRNLSTNPHWLPPEPALKTKDNEVIRNAMCQLTQSIVVPELAVVNGRSELSNFFGLGTATDDGQNSSSVIAPKPAHDVLSNRKQVEALNDLSELLPAFQALSVDSVLQQEIRMMHESDGIDVKRAYTLRQETQKLMIDSSSAKEGFIIWLDLVKQKALPSIHQLSPLPFDPKLSLDKIDELELEVFEETPTEAIDDDILSKEAAKKRKKKATADGKEADSFNKQVKAANEIALACRWVLEQLASSRISEAARSAIFDESHFQAVQLTINEINWLKAHNSVEKVLHLTCLAYAAAPKWEPYPQTILSVQDLEKIEAERSAYRKAIEEASKLASQLLVRRGDNIDPTQQIVEFGFDNVGFVKERLEKAKANRATAAKKKKKSTAGPSSAAAVSVVTAPANSSSSLSSSSSSSIIQSNHHDDNSGICDTIECNETAVGICMVTGSSCGTHKFCVLHVAHSSHEWHKTKDITTTSSTTTITNKSPTSSAYASKSVTTNAATKGSNSTKKKGPPVSKVNNNIPSSSSSLLPTRNNASNMVMVVHNADDMSPSVDASRSSLRVERSRVTLITSEESPTPIAEPHHNTVTSSLLHVDDDEPPPPAVEPLSGIGLLHNTADELSIPKLPTTTITYQPLIPLSCAAALPPPPPPLDTTTIITSSTTAVLLPTCSMPSMSATSSAAIRQHIPDESSNSSSKILVVDAADLACLDEGTRQLHFKIVTIILQESHTKLKDYVSRLDREFSTHGTFYFSGLAKLAHYLYKLEIPMLMTEEADAVRSIELPLQNYKKLINAAQKKYVNVKFVQQFCSLLVAKFINNTKA